MKNTSISKLKGVTQLIIACFFLTAPLATAFAACCSGHGGIASCNKSTGHQLCKDGTASPTCLCTPKTTFKPKTSTTTPLTTKSQTTKTTPPTKSITNGSSARGCCSRHGGVSQCNQSTHYLKCKDGTASPSCTCQ